MKILLTGGGTGGHFYPLIAIAEQLNELKNKEKIIDLKIFYMSDKPYDKKALFDNKITFIQVPSGKMRIYFSIKNFFDIFQTMTGLFWGIITMFFIFPDVVISKGGYASFPAVFAAKIFKIPVIVHESDSFPGRMNVWASKFAENIAISWSEAIEYLPKDKTVLTGQPIRKDILHGDPTGAHEFFKLDKNKKTILVLGGSQGAETINNIILETLPDLLYKYQIIHQTGTLNFDDVKARFNLIMSENHNKERYIPVPFLNVLSTRMAAGCADIIISRAGSAIFEIASWGIPSIIIPITNSNGNHQRKNAFNYARTGACEVIEENNLSKNLLIAEIEKILSSDDKLKEMKKNALSFSNQDAALKIAQRAIDIGLTHY